MNKKIFIAEDLSQEQKRITLIHELTHCYIWCYGTRFETCDEEDICNINMNSHDMINKIVEDYFKAGKNE